MKFIDNVKVEDMCPQDGTVVVDKKPGGGVRCMYMICGEVINKDESYCKIHRILNLNTYQIVERNFGTPKEAYRYIADNLVKDELPIVICNPEAISSLVEGFVNNYSCGYCIMRFINETKVEEPKIDIGTILIEDPNDDSKSIYMVCNARDIMSGVYGYKIVDLQKYEILPIVFVDLEEIYDYIKDILVTSVDKMVIYIPGERC